MELLNQGEVLFIAKQCGFYNVIKWSLEEFQDKVIGYLGDHLHLLIETESNGIKLEIKLFVKCMPRFDKWKAEYLKESRFFRKEYIMLTKLFNQFDNPEGLKKWRPKLLFSKEDTFVFEDVSIQDYKMPFHQETLTFEELKASIVTLARFHAQSYIFEERKTKELGRPYRIWEDYGDYLQEPSKGMDWRDAGRNAVIDFLKVFSKYKYKPNFNTRLNLVVSSLYNQAIRLMKPSSEYRNVVVHRDLWTNNIFLKKEAGLPYHALFVDFQTVIYCPSMLDLSSLIYFNTCRNSRCIWTDELVEFYHTVLAEELGAASFNIEHIFPKNTVKASYEKSIVFGITQAALITPIVAMSKEKREEIFCSSKSEEANLVSRSEEFIQIAKEDNKYRIRITELFDEIVERFVLPMENGVCYRL